MTGDGRVADVDLRSLSAPRWGVVGVRLFVGCVCASLTLVTGCQVVSGLDAYQVVATEVVATAWEKSWGGETNDFATCVAVDEVDNVFVAGVFTDQIDLGGEPLFVTGTANPFIAKLDINGEHIWSQALVSNQSAVPFACVVTTDGDLAVAGVFTGKLDLGGETLDAGSDGAVFIARFASDTGTPKWGHAITGYDPDEVLIGEGFPALVAAAGGDLVMRIRLPDTLQVIGDELVPVGLDDFVLLRLNPSGAKSWQKHVRSGVGDIINFVPASLRPPLAIDQADHILVAGEFRSTFEVDATVLTAQTKLDVFVARFEPDGTLAVATRFGGVGGQYATDIAAGTAGQLVVSGAHQQGLQIGEEWFPRKSETGPDLFISTLSSDNLAHVRTTTLAADPYVDPDAGPDASTLSAYAVSLDVDANQDILISGLLGGTLTVGSSTLTSFGGSDMFFAKLSAEGDEIVATRYGSAGNDYAFDGVLDSRGHVVVVGRYGAQMKIGEKTLVSEGADDAFVIKWVP